jgi:hypothetical protein
MTSRRALTAAVSLLAVAGLAAFEASSGPSGASRTETELHGAFGGAPIFVALAGQPVTPANLSSVYGLEQRIGRLPGVSAVYGPGTFVAQTARATEAVLDRDLAAMRGAGKADAAAATSVRMGFSGPPSISNWSFVSQLVLGAGVRPKQELEWLFPDANHAVITVLARPGVSTAALDGRIARATAGAQLVAVSAQVVGTGAWRQLERELNMRGSLREAARAAERTRRLFATLARWSRA